MDTDDDYRRLIRVYDIKVTHPMKAKDLAIQASTKSGKFSFGPFELETAKRPDVKSGYAFPQSPNLFDESVVNEAAKYDIGMARKGNGLTIYNKAEEENGDYKNVALIDNKGKIKYLDKKVPSNIKKQIEDEAKKMMEITNEGNSMIKLKNLMNESIGLGELPSEKLMKMKVSAKDMLDSVNPKKVNESEEDESMKRLDSINKIRQALSKTKDLKRAEFGFLDDVKAKRLLLSLIDHLEKQVKVLSK